MIQHYSSTSCGLYCFAILKYIGQSTKDLYKKCNEFINLFDFEKIEKNEERLHVVLNKTGVKH